MRGEPDLAPQRLAVRTTRRSRRPEPVRQADSAIPVPVQDDGGYPALEIAPPRVPARHDAPQGRSEIGVQRGEPGRARVVVGSRGRVGAQRGTARERRKPGDTRASIIRAGGVARAC